ncbi:iron-sulfur cluster repair protein YtfE (RIC family) [Variovorax sp. TBS-050B]|jgi:iron-sulfur cluster repair protein YtfE (RIC family)|uniref:hemerythrin domain-containing protein n=1 Tax=Variovorax sp. TBS-050B TaxID=2940551 RepID=UPI0024736F48|nr:hemerythrin domain-containing protein [Variovorax sp. TBS-050B]MDH6594939.1 iron-sulfur cluster repair protein YtfE (RIC family) [Variovorax sp. TBS-050B]
MTSFVSRLFPTATNMIRLDHTHVMSTFHQYKPGAPARVKKGLVNTICTALEIHAQLEEEIFYPEMRKVTEDERITQALEEHSEMKRLIGLLRAMEPEARDYDDTLSALMRDVMHHVADEETILLPAAEKLLADKLGDLGAQMTKRRLQLVGPRSGEIAVDMGRAASGNTAAIAMVGLAAAGLLVARRTGHLRWHHRAS